MNTANYTFKVKPSDIREFQTDLRLMRIRHYPFVRRQGYYYVQVFDTNKIAFLQLKYSNN